MLVSLKVFVKGSYLYLSNLNIPFSGLYTLSGYFHTSFHILPFTVLGWSVLSDSSI
jgi:hypothetical protein